MGRLFQIVYVSTAVTPFGPDDLRELLRGSHERNARAGITGLLLYKDGQFMQVLEGEETAVMGLFSRINHDSRHHHVIALLHEPIMERQFPDSLMSFRDLNHEANRGLPGYSEFLNTALDATSFAHDIPKCQRLLLLFKKNIH